MKSLWKKKSDWKSVWIREMEYLCNCKCLSQPAISCNQLIVANQLDNFKQLNGSHSQRSLIQWFVFNVICNSNSMSWTSFFFISDKQSISNLGEMERKPCPRIVVWCDTRSLTLARFMMNVNWPNESLEILWKMGAKRINLTDHLRRFSHNKLASIQANCQPYINQHRSLCLMVSPKLTQIVVFVGKS